jgi:hypothetical protein
MSGARTSCPTQENLIKPQIKNLRKFQDDDHYLNKNFNLVATLLTHTCSHNYIRFDHVQNNKNNTVSRTKLYRIYTVYVCLISTTALHVNDRCLPLIRRKCV